MREIEDCVCWMIEGRELDAAERSSSVGVRTVANCDVGIVSEATILMNFRSTDGEAFQAMKDQIMAAIEAGARRAYLIEELKRQGNYENVSDTLKRYAMIAS